MHQVKETSIYQYEKEKKCNKKMGKSLNRHLIFQKMIFKWPINVWHLVQPHLLPWK